MVRENATMKQELWVETRKCMQKIQSALKC